MTSTAHPSSARSRRRGTRGFAAFVAAIAGFVSLAVGAVVPACHLARLGRPQLARPARHRLRHRALRRGRWSRPEPPVGRPPDRLPRRDRHRRRRLRAAGDHHRPRPVRRDELPAGAGGQGRGLRAHGLDDRPLAGRRPLRHPWRRADRSTGPPLRWPCRRCLTPRRPGSPAPTRTPTTDAHHPVVRVYVICHAADGTFAG